MYEVFKILHALKLNLSNYQNSKLCKNKKNQARRESSQAKCAPQIYNLSDQFLFQFRPIHISDQILFQTNSYFRPIPISDQFLFPTNSFFRPIPISDQFLFPTMQIVRLAHFQESTASVRPLVETINKEFQKLSSAASAI